MSQISIEQDAIEDIAGGEFERTPVPKSKLKGWKSFIGMYAGEHAAGTEFMIGPLFLTAGVSAFDLIIGLLLGKNLSKHIKSFMPLYTTLKTSSSSKVFSNFPVKELILLKHSFSSSNSIG